MDILDENSTHTIIIIIIVSSKKTNQTNPCPKALAFRYAILSCSISTISLLHAHISFIRKGLPQPFITPPRPLTSFASHSYKYKYTQAFTSGECAPKAKENQKALNPNTYTLKCLSIKIIPLSVNMCYLNMQR